jgi:hypothetical protein
VRRSCNPAERRDFAQKLGAWLAGFPKKSFFLFILSLSYCVSKTSVLGVR